MPRGLSLDASTSRSQRAMCGSCACARARALEFPRGKRAIRDVGRILRAAQSMPSLKKATSFAQRE